MPIITIKRHFILPLSLFFTLILLTAAFTQTERNELYKTPVFYANNIPCTGTYDVALDEDNDGYSNADEIDNGTDPCLASSIPPDHDGDLISDLNDPDDDNDSLLDNLDPFALDPLDGVQNFAPINYDFFVNNGQAIPGTLFGLGFTGVMMNSKSITHGIWGSYTYTHIPGNDYLTFLDASKIIVGNPDGKLILKDVGPGTAVGSNDNQINALQFGVNNGESTPTYTIHARLDSPFFVVNGNQTNPSGNMAAGIYVGSGNQDLFWQLVVRRVDYKAGIEFKLEYKGVQDHYDIYSSNLVGDILSSPSVDLYIETGPHIIKPHVSLDGGQTIITLLPNYLTTPEEWTLNGDSTGMAVGIIATSAGTSTPFDATFDFIKIENTIPVQTNVFPDITRRPGSSNDTINLDTYLDRDGGPSTLSYSASSSNLAVGRVVNGNQLILSYPNEPASSTIDVSVYDGNSWLYFQTFQVNVENQIPVASATANPLAGSIPLQVNFNATASSDADNDPLSFSWDFGDGAQDTGAIVTHTYTQPGNYTATLTVDDGYFGTDQLSFNIAVADTFSCNADSTTYLSDINWTYMVNRQKDIQKDESYDNNPLTINGQTYAKGLGAHAYSEVIYQLLSRYDRFKSDIGVDDETCNSGQVVFKVFADGVLIYDSGILTQADNAVSVDLDIQGVDELKLIVEDGGNNIWCDHADWADARVEIICTNTPVNQPPTAVATATPNTGNVPLQVNFDGSASSDPDNDPLTYVWNFGDGNQGSGASPSHTYTQIGNYIATLTVDDGNGGTDQATVNISVSDSAIVLNSISDQTNSEGENVSLQVVASGGDGALSYSANGLPGGLSINSSTGEISGTIISNASANSPYSVTVTVDDSDADPTDIVSTSFTWTINDGSPQPGDVWLEAECGTVGANWTEITDALASNGLNLITSGPSSLVAPSGDPDDILSFSFEVSQAGQYKVFGRVKAPTSNDDSYWVRVNGGSWIKWNQIQASSSWTWDQVHDNDNANAAVLFNLNAGFNTLEIAQREDGTSLDKVYITQTGGPPTGEGNAGSNCIGGVPISVDPIADQSNVDGESVQLNVIASGGDGPLSFSATGLPGGLSINPITGQISGTIDASASASSPYSVIVTVDDNDATQADAQAVSFTWNVSPNGSGSSEVWLEAECGIVGSAWTVLSDAAASEGSYLNYLSTGFLGAPSGDTAYYVRYDFNISTAGQYKVFARIQAPSSNDDSYWVRVNGGSWIKWNSIQSSTSWTWDQVHDNANGNAPVLFNMVSGINTLELAGREDGTLVDKLYITLTGSAPTGIGALATNCELTEIPIVVNSIADQTHDEGDPVNLPVVASGGNGALVYSANGLPGGLSMNANTGIISGVIDGLASANSPYSVTITVDDSDAGNTDAVSTSFNWTVNQSSVPIVLNSVSDQEDSEAETISLQVNASGGDGALSFAASGLPPGLSINPATGLISGVISNGAANASPYLVTVTVDDADTDPTDIESTSFNWTVDTVSAVVTEQWLEAECGIVGANWTDIADGGGSNGHYMRSPATDFNVSPSSDPADHIRFDFSLTQAGQYKVFGRVLALNGGDDSFWVRANGGSWVKWNAIQKSTTLIWDQVHDNANGNSLVLFNLVAGNNTLEFAGRESGTILDKVYITLTGNTPTGIGTPATNCAAAFASNPTGGATNQITNGNQSIEQTETASFELMIDAYPNPLSTDGGTLTLAFEPAVDEAISYTLTDIQGRAVQEDKVSFDRSGRFGSISIKPLPSGMYMLVIKGESFIQMKRIKIEDK